MHIACLFLQVFQCLFSLFVYSLLISLHKHVLCCYLYPSFVQLCTLADEENQADGELAVVILSVCMFLLLSFCYAQHNQF